MLGSFLLNALIVLSYGCSTNIFSPIAKPDPAERATVALEEDRSDDAISILEAELQSEPENWLYVSLLASAKAQKAGVDTTGLALSLAQNGEAESSGLNALFNVLPPASAANIVLLRQASDLLESIPSSEREAPELFKMSMFGTALTALEAKSFDSDGSGTFTIDELATMDEESAISIIENLINAGQAAVIYQSSGGSGDPSTAIAQIKDKLDAQPGNTQAEKLKNLLSSNAKT